MKAFFAMIAMVLIGTALSSTNAQARFRKPKYVCTGACSNGGNSVDIYRDNDADGNYDVIEHITCEGKVTREYGDWPDVTENGTPTSGLTIYDDGLNPETQIYMWHATYNFSGGQISIAYDGSEGGDVVITGGIS